MKRVACLLLIVLIAYAGCADKKTSKVTVIPSPRDPWSTPDESWESNKVLQFKNQSLEMEINRLKDKVNKNDASLIRISDLEAVIDSQKSEIKILENEHRLYELVIESQKVTIETLQKLCRLYEAENQ